MSTLLNKFNQATGQEASTERISMPALLVSEEVAPNVFLPHENLFITNTEMAKGLNDGDPETLAITFEKRQVQEDGTAVPVGRTTVYMYNNINATNQFDGNKPYTAEQIFEQMIKFQEKILHIVSAFVPKDKLAFDMFILTEADHATLSAQLSENNYVEFGKHIPKVYKACVQYAFAYLTSDKIDVANTPLKVKFVRQSEAKARPSFPDYLTFFTPVGGETQEIKSNFISSMVDVAKCNSIRYTDYERGVRKNGVNSYDKSNPYEKVATAPKSNVAAKSAFAGFGQAATTQPQNSNAGTPASPKANPFG